jgi:formylglycine-generating enzyme required for sulfatase activity
MTYENGYEIVVGVRLIPARASVYIGSTKLPWGEVLGRKDKGYPNILVTESHRIPSQRQALQESLEVVQPLNSPSTLRQPFDGAQDSAGLRRCHFDYAQCRPEFTEGTTLRTPPVKPFEPEMVPIPAGEFTTGNDHSLDQDAVDEGQPQRTLCLLDYYLAKTPVTNAQYAAFVQATGHHPPDRWIGRQPPTGKEDHPVVYVSWHDAMAYCHWLAEETGKPYRLPSEAEWEMGARDSDGRIYPWGSQRDGKRCNTAGGEQGAIPCNLLDMAGNVWEWTRSVYEVYLYDPENGREDIRSGVGRVLRGGSWYRNQWYARCTLRYEVYPGARYHYLGFRVAASLGPKSACGGPSQTPGRFGGHSLP